jgi:hypothetical protein
MQLNVPIDLPLVDRAEAEMFDILFQQFISDTQKIWTLNRKFESRVQPVLRVIGLAIGIFAFALTGLISIYSGLVCLILAPGSTEHCKDFSLGMGLFLFSCVALAFFYFFPSIARKIDEYIKRFQDAWGTKLCRMLARKAFENARASAPYQAEYSLTDGVLQYALNKDGMSRRFWSRPLKGVAIYGESVTVFFKHWTAVQPIMVIFHGEFSRLEPILRHQGILFRSKYEMSVRE